MKMLIPLVLILSMLVPSHAEPAASITVPVTEDLTFHSAILEIHADDFNASGFALGDSCDIVFSSGYALEDVPYYDGFFVRYDTPLICAYPGIDEPFIQFCNGRPVWSEAGLKEGDSVTITLREKGKYLVTEQTMSMVYSNDRADYQSDEAFANFRPMKGGAIAQGQFYRGASPVDDYMGRASTVDRLIRDHGIQTDLDIADTREEVMEYMAEPDYSSDYFKSLFEADHVLTLGMGASYQSAATRTAIAQALRDITHLEKPVYIHCLEGKDRTGFVCALLEALCGATYDEMVEDYMATYENYYGITLETAPDQYETLISLNFNNILEGMGASGGEYREGARSYLLDSGMTEDEIAGLIAYLTEG